MAPDAPHAQKRRVHGRRLRCCDRVRAAVAPVVIVAPSLIGRRAEQEPFRASVSDASQDPRLLLFHLDGHRHAHCGQFVLELAALAGEGLRRLR